MTADFIFLIVGAALLLAVVLPNVLSGRAISAPMVLLLGGMLVGLLPVPTGVSPSPLVNRAFIEHLTELTVIIALMGVGLAIDRPLSLTSFKGWRRWGATWRLLVLAMPLCILGVAVLGWWVMGLAPAAAVLLGAVLAPTDPVLASDVQVGGPTTGDDFDPDEIDEEQEVRFALTSEAGLNDGLAFPFVYFAVFMATMGSFSEWGLRWFAWELVGKIVVGLVFGVATGWVLAKLAFASSQPSLRLAEIGEPLLALAAVLLSYGLAEAIGGGYGFLAVFACAMTLRSAERWHHYHENMHESIDRLERLFTMIVLLLLGVALTDSLLAELTWRGALVGLALIFVVRPVAGFLALRLPLGRRRMGDVCLTNPERNAAAFFGVRGVGSLYYLAYAAGETEVQYLEQLWATVAFTIAVSVIVHGVTATPVMNRLEEAS